MKRIQYIYTILRRKKCIQKFMEVQRFYLLWKVNIWLFCLYELNNYCLFYLKTHWAMPCLVILEEILYSLNSYKRKLNNAFGRNVEIEPNV